MAFACDCHGIYCCDAFVLFGGICEFCARVMRTLAISFSGAYRGGNGEKSYAAYTIFGSPNNLTVHFALKKGNDGLTSLNNVIC